MSRSRILRYKPSAAAAQRSIDINIEGFSVFNRSSENWILLGTVVMGKSMTSESSDTYGRNNLLEYSSATYLTLYPSCSNPTPIAMAPGGPSVSGAPALRI